ncbi:flagellar basal body P-ring formation protein FlgA [Vibrio sp. S4M6]|uniref:flagellar basal body P-ring formation chaperone FlgA n=1 Tax=Vibrio sinus TaxID=2946865 RepID=UPI00202A0DBD|nr:flagellar basal body P-ring formation chaperone FlgA [Vibrio sinus]MCL9783910.1 flagellar basal body P-ring formation protein FlgA [Vibrio sinus]
MFDLTIRSYPLSISKCRAFLKVFYLSVTFFCVLFSSSSYSATKQQIIDIQKAAQEHVLRTVKSEPGTQLTAHAASIDSRIRASNCPEPLSTSSNSKNPAASNITVLVSCPSDNWRVYVPVRLTLTGPQVVAKHNLDRGQILNNSDVTVGMVDLLKQRRQGFSSPSGILGAKLKRNIRAGEAIESSDICVVCRNETVVIKAIHNGMAITTKGTALTDGSQGEQIKVKNNKSNRIIVGRVTGIAEVTVQF